MLDEIKTSNPIIGMITLQIVKAYNKPNLVLVCYLTPKFVVGLRPLIAYRIMKPFRFTTCIGL